MLQAFSIKVRGYVRARVARKINDDDSDDNFEIRACRETEIVEVRGVNNCAVEESERKARGKACLSERFVASMGTHKIAWLCECSVWRYKAGFRRAKHSVASVE